MIVNGGVHRAAGREKKLASTDIEVIHIMSGGSFHFKTDVAGIVNQKREAFPFLVRNTGRGGIRWPTKEIARGIRCSWQPM